MNYSYTSTTKPGKSDPYWYEWSVGEKYLLDMLYEESNIEAVAFQGNISLGLDDVVVYYKDESIKCIQVKHTRADDTLTYADLVSPKSDDKISLLGELAESWHKERNNYKIIVPQIFTNRKLGEKVSTTKRADGFKRPALKDFLLELKGQLHNDNTQYSDIHFDGYEQAWEEWKEQLSVIPEDKDRIEFLRLLEIETSQPDLESIEKQLIEETALVFGVNENIATELFTKLDQKMRYWTSTLANKEKINPEAVWDALAENTVKPSYNHDLCPCNPFFTSREGFIDELEKELICGNERVIFLKGLPGIGKTNIISKLSNKRDSVIRIRYYAYEPVQPDKEYLPIDASERVRKDVFWNELFSQLRYLLKGKLKKYNVPLQNDFMTLGDMKDRFFEIASKYALDEKTIFVVAIDGIDHAARAGEGIDTFLNTLPNPAYIPKNVKLLIAGQPEEGYEQYPYWLFDEDDNVKKIDVPGIQREDIALLVSDKISDDRMSEYPVITDIIDRIANGNTLSAIFAVHEASMFTDVSQLEKHLKERKLHVNLEQYYYNIWDNAKRKINSHGFVDYKLAGALILFNEKLDGSILEEMFKEENISERTWEDMLEALKPLVIEEQCGYRLLHNDIKVFLTRLIKNGNRSAYISDAIATYYINSRIKSQVYYYDICKLLKMAERQRDIINIFTPEFVIASYVNGVGLEVLSINASEILKDLLSMEDIDWNCMIDLSAAWDTIEQIYKTVNEIEDYEITDKNDNNMISYSENECKVVELSQWDAELIADVLGRIDELYKIDVRRSEGMFLRWFSDMNVLDIWNNICKKGMLDERFSDDDNILLAETAKEIARNLGIMICRFKKYWMLEDYIDEDKFDTFIGILETTYFKECVSIYSGDDLRNSLNFNYYIFRDDLFDICLQCIKYCRYEDIGIIEESFRDRISKTENKTFILLDIFMKIVSGNIGFPDKYERNAIWNQIKDVELSEISYEYKSIYYCVYAFVTGYLNVSVDSDTNASYVLELYANNNSRVKGTYYGAVFNLMCVLGNWLYQLKNNKVDSIDEKKITFLLERIFICNHNIFEEDYNIRKHYSEILIAFINCMEKSGTELKQTVGACLDRLFENYPIDQKIDAYWYCYRNNKEKLKEYVAFWTNDNSRIWEQEIGERNRLAYDIIRLARQYNLYEYLKLQNFYDKAKWSVIGYVSHKEYSFSNIMEWYTAVSDLSSIRAGEFSNEVKLISDKVEDIGDNRLSYNVNCRVYSDIFSGGLENIINALKDDRYFQEMISKPEYIVEGLVGLLRENKFSRKQLLLIWTFGIGISDWKNESNGSHIAALKYALCKNAEQNNADVNIDDLKDIGPAEVCCYADPVRYIIPDRWYDDKNADSESDKSATDDNSIRDRLISGLNGEVKYFYPYKELEDACKKRIAVSDADYVVYGLRQYLNMQKEWLSSAGHINVSINEFDRDEDILKSREFLDINTIYSLEILFIRMLLLMILSNDADRAETALRALYHILKLQPELLNVVDGYWKQLHFRAKEWYLMILELLIDDGIAIDEISDVLHSHTDTEEFNAAMYIRLLIFKINDIMGVDEPVYNLAEQAFFKQIHDAGSKKFIKYHNAARTVSGGQYVMSVIKKLNSMISDGGDNLEERVAEYISQVRTTDSVLFKVGNNVQLGVSVCKENIAMQDIMYKDFYNGRWHMDCVSMLQCVLSSTEPYILLNSAPMFPYNDGKFFNERKEEFLERSDNVQKNYVHQILNYGINEEEEKLLGGVVVDYMGEREIEGLLFSYLQLANAYDDELAKNSGHMNGRSILINYAGFNEETCCNIIIRNGGTASFNLSQKICDISYYAMRCFGWKTIVDNGIYAVNKDGERVVRFEMYNGVRDIGNRYYCLQPVMQRWVIKKSEYERIQELCGRFEIKETMSIEVSEAR